jgi:hypothetical protein
VLEALAFPALVTLGAAFLVWYLGGNELMRRRAHRLAVWSKRAVDPFGGKQSVQWLTQQAFRLQVEAAKPPFKAATVTGLVESWDVPMIWLWNRLHGRRDMVVLQLGLREAPLWGFEVYRPGSILAGDARHFARQEGWEEASLDEFTVAAAGEAPRQLAARLVELLEQDRERLVRLAVRRQGAVLTVALNVADPNGFEPRRVAELARRLAGGISR